MLYQGGHRSTPRVIAAFAGPVHDRQRAADYEHNRDKDSYYGSVHCNLPAAEQKPTHEPADAVLASPLAPLTAYHLRERWVF